MNKKGNIGIGILAMPYAFKNAGLWLGLFATLAIGILHNGERTDERTKERLGLHRGFRIRIRNSEGQFQIFLAAGVVPTRKL